MMMINIMMMMRNLFSRSGTSSSVGKTGTKHGETLTVDLDHFFIDNNSVMNDNDNNFYN